MLGQQDENDNLQAQQPANNDNWVRRSSRATGQSDRFVPGANNVADYVIVTESGELPCFKEDKNDNNKYSKAILSKMGSLEKINKDECHF